LAAGLLALDEPALATKIFPNCWGLRREQGHLRDLKFPGKDAAPVTDLTSYSTSWKATSIPSAAV